MDSSLHPKSSNEGRGKIQKDSKEPWGNIKGMLVFLGSLKRLYMVGHALFSLRFHGW